MTCAAIPGARSLASVALAIVIAHGASAALGAQGRGQAVPPGWAEFTRVFETQSEASVRVAVVTDVHANLPAPVNRLRGMSRVDPP